MTGGFRKRFNKNSSHETVFMISPFGFVGFVTKFSLCVMDVLPACISASLICISGVHGGRKRTSYPLELELGTVVSHHMCTSSLKEQPVLSDHRDLQPIIETGPCCTFQTDFKLSAIFLPQPLRVGITGMCHHVQLAFFSFLSVLQCKPDTMMYTCDTRI